MVQNNKITTAPEERKYTREEVNDILELEDGFYGMVASGNSFLSDNPNAVVSNEFFEYTKSYLDRLKKYGEIFEAEISKIEKIVSGLEIVLNKKDIKTKKQKE